jgi:hypothetical protein
LGEAEEGEEDWTVVSPDSQNVHNAAKDRKHDMQAYIECIVQSVDCGHVPTSPVSGWETDYDDDNRWCGLTSNCFCGDSALSSTSGPTLSCPARTPDASLALNVATLPTQFHTTPSAMETAGAIAEPHSDTECATWEAYDSASPTRNSAAGVASNTHTEEDAIPAVDSNEWPSLQEAMHTVKHVRGRHMERRTKDMSVKTKIA